MNRWSIWDGTRISAKGIHTVSGRLLDPRDLDLLCWKAAFYDRGRKGSALPQRFFLGVDSTYRKELRERR